MLAVGVLMGLAQAPAARAADDRLVLTGSSTVAPLALEIAKRFETRHAGVRV
ncbi:MAG: phosphate ABC transporter substrate-binding protein, partial [Alphaproteobacteria bacterium]